MSGPNPPSMFPAPLLSQPMHFPGCGCPAGPALAPKSYDQLLKYHFVQQQQQPPQEQPPLNVAYVLPHHNVTGGMKVLVDHCRLLADAGHRVHALHWTDKDAGEGQGEALPPWAKDLGPKLASQRALGLDESLEDWDLESQVDVFVVGWFTQIPQVMHRKDGSVRFNVVYFEQGHEHIFADPIRHQTLFKESDKQFHMNMWMPCALMGVSGAVRNILEKEFLRYSVPVINAVDANRFVPCGGAQDPAQSKRKRESDDVDAASVDIPKKSKPEAPDDHTSEKNHIATANPQGCKTQGSGSIPGTNTGPPMGLQSSILLAPQPGNPMTPQPGNPMAPQPGNPMAPQPGNPMAPQPGNPMAPQPGNPMAPQPGNPMAPQPGNPLPPRSTTQNHTSTPVYQYANEPDPPLPEGDLVLNTKPVSQETPSNVNPQLDDDKVYKILLIGNPRLPLKGFPIAFEVLRLVQAVYGVKMSPVLVCQQLPVPGSDLESSGKKLGIKYIENPAQDELPNLYKGFDVMLFCSHYEGWGLPVLEAMSCGVPVVTTACHGVSEFAVHNVNCMMSSPGDESSLASQVFQLLVDQVISMRLAKEGRATALRFSPQAQTAQLVHALRAVANMKPYNTVDQLVGAASQLSPTCPVMMVPVPGMVNACVAGQPMQPGAFQIQPMQPQFAVMPPQMLTAPMQQHVFAANPMSVVPMVAPGQTTGIPPQQQPHVNPMSVPHPVAQGHQQPHANPMSAPHPVAQGHQQPLANPMSAGLTAPMPVGFATMPPHVNMIPPNCQPLAGAVPQQPVFFQLPNVVPPHMVFGGMPGTTAPVGSGIPQHVPRQNAPGVNMASPTGIAPHRAAQQVLGGANAASSQAEYQASHIANVPGLPKGGLVVEQPQPPAADRDEPSNEQPVQPQSVNESAPPHQG